jgi:hypothetical protein
MLSAFLLVRPKGRFFGLSTRTIPWIFYDTDTITVEHVLPQTPREKSERLKNFPTDTDCQWTLSFANLLSVRGRDVDPGWMGTTKGMISMLAAPPSTPGTKTRGIRTPQLAGGVPGEISCDATSRVLQRSYGQPGA